MNGQESENAFEVIIIDSTSNQDVYNKINSLDGVKSIIQNKENIKETTSEHKASIVNNGLILHNHFFQKMN